jgi:hypothetical protein
MFIGFRIEQEVFLNPSRKSENRRFTMLVERGAHPIWLRAYLARWFENYREEDGKRTGSDHRFF